MKLKKQAKKSILKLLAESPRSKQALVQDVAIEKMLENHVKKAVKTLVKKMKIRESDGIYMYSLQKMEGESSVDNHGVPEETTVKPLTKETEALPIPEIFWRRAAKQNSEKGISLGNENKQEESIDADEEIRRLEAELAADESDSES